MKYINKLTWSLVLFAAFTGACTDDDEPSIPAGLTVDKEEITVGPEGGSEMISISASDSWVANASAPWVLVSPANGIGAAEGSIVIDSTLEAGARNTELRFKMAGAQSKTVNVIQFGFGKQIYLKEPEVEIEASARVDDRYFESLISANVECKIEKVEYDFEGTVRPEDEADVAGEKEGWLLDKDGADKLTGMDLGIVLDRKSRPRSVKTRFRWQMNIVPYVRVAKVYLVAKNPETDQLVDNDGNEVDHVILTVKQKAAPRIEDNRSGDSLAVITINQKIQSMITFDTSENMRNWESVTLWEATDDDLPESEAVGRVRSLSLSMFNLKDGETLPKEIRYLKYLESFSISSNENNQIRDVRLCDEICGLRYLKHLTVAAYGLTVLPDNFKDLGEKLETLDLTSNNFATLSEVTEVINKTNFPRLYALYLIGQRRSDVVTDLQSLGGNYVYNNYPIGLHVNLSTDSKEKNALFSLLTWEELEALELSYGFIEGSLPTDAEMEQALKDAGKRTQYTEEDFSDAPADYRTKLVGDTCRWLLSDREVPCMKRDGTPVVDENGDPISLTGQQVPRVLPRARVFSINLNFFTGTLPAWMLYHPYFAYWLPNSLVFPQQERGKDSAGNTVGFSNIDEDNFDFGYYYGKSDPGKETTVPGVAYPIYYRVFVADNTSTASTRRR